MKTREDVERALELNGFKLHREGNHFVYKRGSMTLVTSKTPSDFRAFEKQYADLRRLVTSNGHDFITDEIFKPKDKPIMQYADKPPVSRPDTFRNAPTIVAPPQPKIQKLDANALELCKSVIAGGGTQKQACDQLARMGYTSPLGGAMTQKQVSVFMNANGIRLRGEYTKGETASEPKVQKVPKATKTHKFLESLSELLTSNLSDEMKERFILQIFEEYTK